MKASWKLSNSEKTHSKNPDTFWIPDEGERNSLEPGDLAKLVFLGEEGGERMWVEVVKATDGGYVGSLANNPLFIYDLEHGDHVSFKAKHVIEIRENC